MTVRTSITQGTDVRDHYRIEPDASHFIRASRTAMIQLIDRIESEFRRTDVWLMTSHDRLVLMNKPACDGAPWHVMVASIIGQDHEICHRIPAAKSPYPNGAWVHANARNSDEAVQYLKIAMRESEGWPPGPELEL